MNFMNFYIFHIFSKSAITGKDKSILTTSITNIEDNEYWKSYKKCHFYTDSLKKRCRKPNTLYLLSYNNNKPR